MKIYSGAGLTPIVSPTPIINGRMYKLPPVPYGGIQCSFARTTSLIASTNRSCGNSGINKRVQERAKRAAF